MKIEFSEEIYKRLKKLKTRKTKSEYDNTLDQVLCSITDGAVDCQFILVEDDFSDPESKKFRINKNFALFACYYVLGIKSTYGERNGTPYDLRGGFYIPLADTYEEMISDMITKFYENMDKETHEACKNTKLTWENIDTIEVEVGINCLAVYTGRIRIPLSELGGADPNTEEGQKLIRKYLENNIPDINKVNELEWVGDDEDEPLSGWCRVNPDTDKEIKFFIDY